MSPSAPAPALSRARLTELLTRMRGRQVVVVGDAMLDRYLIGDIERISPEAPVPVVSVTERRLALGGAANVAANVAALGGRVQLVAVIGADPEGEALRAELVRHGIDDRFLLTVPHRPTTSKTRVVARGQQVVRIDEEEAHALDPEVAQRLAALAAEAVAAAEAVLFEDYDKGALDPGLISAAMGAAERAVAPHGGRPEVPFVLPL